VIPARNRFYRDALAAPHKPRVRVEVWRSGLQVEELVWRERGTMKYQLDMPVFFGGNLRATLSSRVTRTLTLAVPDSLYPWSPRDLLNPYGTELRAFRGITYGSGSYDEFPCFVGPIEACKPNRNGEVTVEASDNSVRVSRAGFVSPLPAQVGDPVLDEFERVVLDANPRAVFGRHDPITAKVPAGLAYDGDRGAALDSLAKAANAFWYCLADGSYVMRWVPWSRSPSSSVLELTDGPGGTLASAYPVRASGDLYNRFTFTSDAPTGGAPMYATAQDDDPDSPTWVGGPFGVRSFQARVTGAANQGQLFVMARTAVARTRSLAESWSITCVADGSIELGDPLGVRYRGHRAVQLAAGFTMPLEPHAVMSIDGRAYNAADVEEGE